MINCFLRSTYTIKYPTGGLKILIYVALLIKVEQIININHLLLIRNLRLLNIFGYRALK